LNFKSTIKNALGFWNNLKKDEMSLILKPFTGPSFYYSKCLKYLKQVCILVKNINTLIYNNEKHPFNAGLEKQQDYTMIKT